MFPTTQLRRELSGLDLQVERMDYSIIFSSAVMLCASTKYPNTYTLMIASLTGSHSVEIDVSFELAQAAYIRECARFDRPADRTEKCE